MTNTHSDPSNDLCAFTDCEVVPMMNGAVLLVDKFSDAQALVAQSVAQSMQGCRIFRTLQGHADYLTSTVPELAGQGADVLGVLSMLRDTGLMVAANDVCQQLNAPVAPPLDLPPTRCFIITCDRPEAVERLLESTLRAGNLSRHQALYLVDDSRNPACAEQNREAVQRFNLTSPRDMRYFGATEAKHFMNELIAKRPEQEAAIRFLIDREHWSGNTTHGLARNLCMLLSVGCRAIVMDDDVLCTAMVAPHRKSGVTFGAVEKEADFYADHQEMLQRATPAEFDPFAGHAECLGLNIGQALQKLLPESLTSADLAGANAGYLRLWQARSPVLITQCGTLGDPGSPATDWIYYAEGETAKRLTEFGGGIEGALTSRSYWVGHPRPCFTKMAGMSQVTGLDNSQLLPPYFPLYRGEHYLFGAMAEHLHPQGAVLNYDWCVPHLPVEERKSPAEPEPKSGKGLFSPGKYVTDRTVYQRGITPETRLQGLANLALQLSQTDDRGLSTRFRQEVAEMQGLEQFKLSSILGDGNIRAPAWQSWLETSARNVQGAMRELAQPDDLPNLPGELDNAALLERFRRHAAAFGDALAGWTRIRAAAKTLNEPA